MIHYKNVHEVELMRQSALLVSATLTEVARILKPGITTLSIDELIGDLIKSYGATPSFLNYHSYP
ncbi:MAG: type I methionyl aminopeptidase, partial [Bacteroidota bacterium]